MLLKRLCCFYTVIIAHCNNSAFYWALQSSLSENISYRSMDDLLLYIDTLIWLSRRSVILFAFKWCFMTLCKSLVAQLTVHLVLSSRRDLKQYDLQNEAGNGSEATQSCLFSLLQRRNCCQSFCMFQKILFPYSHGAGLSFFCMLILQKPFLRHLAWIS